MSRLKLARDFLSVAFWTVNNRLSPVSSYCLKESLSKWTSFTQLSTVPPDTQTCTSDDLSKEQLTCCLCINAVQPTNTSDEQAKGSGEYNKEDTIFALKG